MTRAIIDLPAVMVRAIRIDWDIDWRGQSAGAGNDDGEQVVYNRLPRIVGTPALRLPPEMIGHWRALRARAQGRVNVWRVPMVDPVSYPARAADWRTEWQAYLQGHWQAYRPQITCVAAAAAGAATVVVDERASPEPVRVGAWLSRSDWPFLVTGRSGPNGAGQTTLDVTHFRRAIPAGAAIDLLARGLFLAESDTAGNPAYGMDRVAEFDMPFREWVTR